MTLLFGNLTVSFVDFGIAVNNASQLGATQDAFDRVNAAADEFRKVAAKDALYLVLIGENVFSFSLLPAPVLALLALDQ